LTEKVKFVITCRYYRHKGLIPVQNNLKAEGLKVYRVYLKP